jgi:hypothetical protein
MFLTGMSGFSIFTMDLNHMNGTPLLFQLGLYAMAMSLPCLNPRHGD